jgi:hypothetical protein
MNWDKGTQSSSERCKVLNTSEDTAEMLSGSISIHVGRDRLLNMSLTRCTTSLIRREQAAEDKRERSYALSDRNVAKMS